MAKNSDMWNHMNPEPPAQKVPAHTGDGTDHGKSNPMAGTSQRDKNHGYGYPLTIDSIDHADPDHGVKPSRNETKHGHSYPGRPYPGKGGAKNASPKPSKKNHNIVG